MKVLVVGTHREKPVRLTGELQPGDRPGQQVVVLQNQGASWRSYCKFRRADRGDPSQKVSSCRPPTTTANRCWKGDWRH